MKLDDYTTTFNPDKKRFELDIEGKLSVIEYTFKKSTNQIFLVHTETHPELRERGVGQKLVKEALDIVREQGFELVPLCPYVVAFLKRHPQYHDLMSESNRQKLN